MTMKHNSERDSIAKIMKEMTPARRQALDDAFKMMVRTPESVQPPMRAMNFGAEYDFDVNRKQVELHGEFSKEDLFRIALTLR